MKQLQDNDTKPKYKVVPLKVKTVADVAKEKEAIKAKKKVAPKKAGKKK
jgi:hypothetical protein